MPTTTTRSRWSRRLTVAGFLLFCVVMAGVFYYVIAYDQRLDRAFKDADELDPGWRLEELEAKRARIPDSKNGALVVMGIATTLPKTWNVPEIDRAASRFRPPHRLSEADLQKLREELNALGKVRYEARKLIDFSQGRFPVSYTTDALSTTLRCHDARPVAQLLRLDAVVRLHDGDITGALDSCRALLNTSAAVGDEPFLISILTRINSRLLAVRTLEQILSQGVARDADLAALQEQIAKELEAELLLNGLRGDRAGLDRFMEAVQRGEASLTALGKRAVTGNVTADEMIARLQMGSPAYNRAVLLEVMNQYVEAAKLPTEQQGQRLSQVQARNRQMAPLVHHMTPAVQKVALACHRDLADMRAAQLALALERYRLKHGRWPERLDQLMPEFLSSIPLDPFDGQPLRYTRTSDGVIVYAVGQDRQDNRGVTEASQPWYKEGQDVIFQLWDVSQRRQPPRPEENQP